FACAKGECARHAGGLSHFTSALASVLSDEPTATTLKLVMDRCQERLDEITDQAAHERQTVILEGLQRGRTDDLVLGRLVRKRPPYDVTGTGAVVAQGGYVYDVEIPLGEAGFARIRHPYIDFVDREGALQLSMGVDPDRVGPNQIAALIGQILN